MSQADALLNTVTEGDPVDYEYAMDSSNEEYIVIDRERVITVPEKKRKIGTMRFFVLHSFMKLVSNDPR